MPTKAALASPGRATAERAALEATLAGQAVRALKVFLVDVEKAAAESMASDGEPLTLGAIQQRWEDFVDWMLLTAMQYENNPAAITALTSAAWAPRNTRTLIPGTDLTRAKYLTAMRDRLRSSPLPEAAYTSAREIMTRGASENRSQRRTIAALQRALHKDAPTELVTTGDLEELLAPMSGPKPKVKTYEQMVRRIARTEATTLYNYGALTRLAESGASSKRWVAHHDGRTRESHLHADGDIAFLSEPFIVGGYSLMVPGDPNAPAHETANCRCVLVDAEVDLLPIVNDIEGTGPLVDAPEIDEYDVPDGYGGFQTLRAPTGNIVKMPKDPPPAAAQAEFAAITGSLPDSGHWAMAQRLRGVNRAPAHYKIQRPLWDDPPGMVPAAEPDPWDVLMAQMTGRKLPPLTAPPVYGKGIAGQIRAMDAAIQRNVTTERSVAFRGFVEFDQPITPGARFTDRMYTSLSLEPDWALRFAKMRSGVDANSVGLVNPNPDRPIVKGTPVVARIVLPKGTYVSPGDSGIKEVILLRGSSFRVLSEEINDGVKWVTMELLPRSLP